MSQQNELQQLNNRLDKCRHKLEAAQKRADKAMIYQFETEINQLSKKVAQLNHKKSYDLNKERKALLEMPFSRALTKDEKADQGKLKKSVKGLVIVHPLTKIGKELKLEEMTGFAPKEF
ncbi:YibL family ribosome-associated protein [Vibrio sp. CK2-1]|uniref:YibL family ribosome-associated protein n=1 Tax=Vibrio sp. CK2-1 TaxID=2912249 RepID=UPI001F31E607|nr:YibL family ribosome-associated protein [Vibrio sp. CK2-1]MCF7353040.1 YibL family ribosome-associated protein [Vibrio sp. CK2-1]